MSGCPQGVSTVQIQSAPAARHDSWAGAFGGDAVLTAAMLDRTLHDATIITERNDRLEKAPEPVYQRDQDVPDWPVPHGSRMLRTTARCASSVRCWVSSHPDDQA
jgi:hypothetical protein